MTVATQSNFTSANGDGLGTVFPFSFPVYDEDHIQVYFRDTTTLEFSLVDPADYTVNGVNNENGGNVTFDSAPDSTVKVFIVRVVPLTQDLDVLNQGGFYPNNVEREFDLAIMQIQQHDEEIGRTVRGQLGETFDTLDPPPERRGKLLGFTDDSLATPTTDTVTLLISLLLDILVAGTGVTITQNGDTIVITNSAPSTGELQDAWLLEDATGGGGGSSGDAEFVRDTIFAALIGVGCTITQDDPGDTITITVTGSLDAEGVRDLMATFLVAGNGIILTPDDPGDTLTIAVNPEYVRDTMGIALQGGLGITVTPDDPGDTISIDLVSDIQTVVSAATVTPTATTTATHITAQAAGLTIANPSGSPNDDQGHLIRIKDNGTARAISWGAKYRVFNDALPTTTVINKTTYVGIVYNAADDKWDVLGVRQEA